jgi:YebC/PmpR family DNA-binding regulatory protein
MRYEGYGPAGVAVIVEALTDNRNRTASEVRAAFSKSGGSMGETNSVSFMFRRLGVITYPASVASEDDMLEAAIEAGAENVVSTDAGHEITCEVESFFAVKDGLEARFGEAESGKLDWRPENTVTLDEEKARSLFKFLDVLEDNDDVQNVYANFDLPDDLAEKLSA